MIKFKMFCPDCGAVIITTTPQAVIWEFCPGCRSHIWDMSDALMAEVVMGKLSEPQQVSSQARLHSN